MLVVTLVVVALVVVTLVVVTLVALDYDLAILATHPADPAVNVLGVGDSDSSCPCSERHGTYSNQRDKFSSTLPYGLSTGL
jgi:hypothetical protein